MSKRRTNQPELPGRGHMIGSDFDDSVRKLEAEWRRHGISPQAAWDFMRINPEFVSQVAAGSRHSKLDPYLTVGEAVEIMGLNIFQPSGWSAYGVDIPQEVLESCTVFPWKRDTLESKCPFDPHRTIKESHFAFYFPGFNVMRCTPVETLSGIWARQTASGQIRVDDYSREWFSRLFDDYYTAGWHLLPKYGVAKPIQYPYVNPPPPPNYKASSTITTLVKLVLGGIVPPHLTTWNRDHVLLCLDVGSRVQCSVFWLGSAEIQIKKAALSAEGRLSLERIPGL